LKTSLPHLNSLVDTRSKEKIRDTLIALINSEIQKPSLLRSYNSINLPDNSNSDSDEQQFYPSSIELLRAKKIDPLSAAVMLEKTISLIPSSLDEFFKTQFPSFEPVFQLTTDEILPIVIWVIVEYLIQPEARDSERVESRVASLVTSLYCCSLFLTDKQRTGQIGYSISTLTAAIEYIESEAEYILQKV